MRWSVRYGRYSSSFCRGVGIFRYLDRVELSGFLRFGLVSFGCFWKDAVSVEGIVFYRVRRRS